MGRLRRRQNFGSLPRDSTTRDNLKMLGIQVNQEGLLYGGQFRWRKYDWRHAHGGQASGALPVLPPSALVLPSAAHKNISTSSCHTAPTITLPSTEFLRSLLPNMEVVPRHTKDSQPLALWDPPLRSLDHKRLQNLPPTRRTPRSANLPSFTPLPRILMATRDRPDSPRQLSSPLLSHLHTAPSREWKFEPHACFLADTPRPTGAT